MGSREVADKFFIETKTAKWHWLIPFKWHWLIPFSASLILKAAESIAYLTSQLYNDLQPAVCLSREKWRPPKHLWMSDKHQKQAIVSKNSLYGYLSVLVQYPLKLLANRYYTCHVV